MRTIRRDPQLLSSHKVQREFQQLKKRYWGRHFWGRGNFSTTNGAITGDIVLVWLSPVKQEALASWLFDRVRSCVRPLCAGSGSGAAQEGRHVGHARMVAKYAPELNDIERVWLDLKAKYFIHLGFDFRPEHNEFRFSL